MLNKKQHLAVLKNSPEIKKIKHIKILGNPNFKIKQFSPLARGENKTMFNAFKESGGDCENSRNISSLAAMTQKPPLY